MDVSGGATVTSRNTGLVFVFCCCENHRLLVEFPALHVGFLEGVSQKWLHRNYFYSWQPWVQQKHWIPTNPHFRCLKMGNMRPQNMAIKQPLDGMRYPVLFKSLCHWAWCLCGSNEYQTSVKFDGPNERKRSIIYGQVSAIGWHQLWQMVVLV